MPCDAKLRPAAPYLGSPHRKTVTKRLACVKDPLPFWYFGPSNLLANSSRLGNVNRSVGGAIGAGARAKRR